MSEQEKNQLLADLSGKYPEFITFKEAAAIARKSTWTVYDWSSRGLRQSCQDWAPKGGSYRAQLIH